MLPPDLTHTVFHEQLHTRFRADGPEAFELELVEVRTLPGGMPGKRAPFALTFRAAEPRARPQKTYELEHERLGRLPIFLVPIAADAKGTTYEAIFN